jgi:HEAT repeat protein
MLELDVLCAELTCGHDIRAEAAAARLPELGLPALQAMQELINSENVDTRWWTVRALAGFEDINAVLVDLLAALTDKSEEVRQAAAMAFCHHPTARALEQLTCALGDPDSMTARLAANALIMLGSQATMALLDVLNDGAPSARLEAVRALSEIKDPRSIPGLMKALETDSGLMQYWAGLGLDKMGVGILYLSPD